MVKSGSRIQSLSERLRDLPFFNTKYFYHLLAAANWFHKRRIKSINDICNNYKSIDIIEIISERFFGEKCNRFIREDMSPIELS